MGHDYLDEATNVGKSVSYGVISKVAMHISGRKCTTLINSGASQCYIALEATAACELHLEKEKLHLELADGSKVQYAHKAPSVTLVGEKPFVK